MPEDAQHASTAADRASSVAVDPNLLDLLVCPFTKKPLIYDAPGQQLFSAAAGLSFPIKSGIPMLSADAARRLTPAEEDMLARAGRLRPHSWADTGSQADPAGPLEKDKGQGDE